MYHILFFPLQRTSFDLYRVYGENNEHAQKLLHELGDDQSMKAFFVVSAYSCENFTSHDRTEKEAFQPLLSDVYFVEPFDVNS
jgi:hypothetical protein